jgi:hypothetical protein
MQPKKKSNRVNPNQSKKIGIEVRKSNFIIGYDSK